MGPWPSIGTGLLAIALARPWRPSDAAGLRFDRRRCGDGAPATRLHRGTAAGPPWGRAADEDEYRLAWARTYLKFMGLLVDSRRGGLDLYRAGRSVREDDVPRLHAEVVARLRGSSGRSAKLSRPRTARLESSSLTTSRTGGSSCSTFWPSDPLMRSSDWRSACLSNGDRTVFTNSGAGRTATAGLTDSGSTACHWRRSPCSSSASGSRQRWSQRHPRHAARWPAEEPRAC